MMRIPPLPTSMASRFAAETSIAIITVSAAFTLLYLTGHIDPEGKQATLAALDTLQKFYNHPEQLTRQTDLQRWDAR